jgi:hypothetical protein
MIVAAYQTTHGVCYINDAAYAGRTPAELNRVRAEISDQVRRILQRVAREDPRELERIEIRNQARALGEIRPAAQPLPLPDPEGSVEH